MVAEPMVAEPMVAEPMVAEPMVAEPGGRAWSGFWSQARLRRQQRFMTFYDFLSTFGNVMLSMLSCGDIGTYLFTNIPHSTTEDLTSRTSARHDGKKVMKAR